jgi:hypothetical protein
MDLLRREHWPEGSPLASASAAGWASHHYSVARASCPPIPDGARSVERKEKLGLPAQVVCRLGSWGRAAALDALGTPRYLLPTLFTQANPRPRRR